jgi:putative transposase
LSFIIVFLGSLFSHRWYALYQSGGPEALGDRSPRPGRVWNRVPDFVRERIIRLALDEPTLGR